MLYTVDQGNAHNQVYAIQEDDKNNIWISTNRGLS